MRLSRGGGTSEKFNQHLAQRPARTTSPWRCSCGARIVRDGLFGIKKDTYAAAKIDAKYGLGAGKAAPPGAKGYEKLEKFTRHLAHLRALRQDDLELAAQIWGQEEGLQQQQQQRQQSQQQPQPQQPQPQQREGGGKAQVRMGPHANPPDDLFSVCRTRTARESSLSAYFMSQQVASTSSKSA